MKKNSKENIARFGMIAKGVVYSIIGVLTAMAAFGEGGQQTGSKGALKYLAQQSFGQILIVILGLGLLGYVFWRFYQSFANPKNLEGLKGNIKRVAYFISGLIYASLVYFAIKLVFGEEGSTSNSGNNSWFQGSVGDIILVIIGIGIIIKAVYDFYRVYSEKFRQEVEEGSMDHKEQKLLINAGRFGYTARGVVLGIMAFLTIKSGFGSGGSVGRKTDAFSFIQLQFGSIGLGIVALGLLGFGIFMFLKAKNPSLSVSNN